MLLNNQWITEETKGEIKIIWRQNENNNPKSVGCSNSSSKREVYSNRSLPQEIKISNNLPLHLKELENEEQTNSKLVEERSNKD